MLSPHQKIAVFMEGATSDPRGKMGFGIIRYSQNPVICVVDSTQAGKNMAEVAQMPKAVPIVATVRNAIEAGADVLVLGIAPPGGRIPGEWLAAIDEAVGAGVSILNGLHDRLEPRYQILRSGQWIWDIRVEPTGLQPSSGQAARLTNSRTVMVGTDMSVGKMTAGLEIWLEARRRGVQAEFVATGQIGIAITGSGVPLDAVRMDYASGAIEREVLQRADAPLVIVEGQGALCHPASSATLPLLRGTMPTHLVLCHRANQLHIWRHPEIRIPPLREMVRLYEEVASVGGIFPRAKVAAVALDTSRLHSAEDAASAVGEIEQDLGIPCSDPVRHGAVRLLDALI